MLIIYIIQLPYKASFGNRRCSSTTRVFLSSKKGGMDLGSNETKLTLEIQDFDLSVNQVKLL